VVKYDVMQFVSVVVKGAMGMRFQRPQAHWPKSMLERWLLLGLHP